MIRKLTCVMFTDIQGYTERMNREEKLGMELLRKHDAIMSDAAKKHDGRVVKSIGDSWLIDFSSAVSAVECAVDAQHAFAACNQGATPDEELLVRMSIHLGEVVVKGGDIFGEGVNLASRIQGVTPGGHICVSKAVYDQVHSKIHCDFQRIGSHRFKGISEPVLVYQVAPPGTVLDAAALRGTAVRNEKTPGAPVVESDAAQWTAALSEIRSSPTLIATTSVLTLMAWFAGPVLLKIVFPLDILNYLLHLGGHTIFGLSGNHALAYFGATFTQLAFPVGAIYHFLKRRELLSADAALFWLGESLLGLGVYVVREPSFTGSLSLCLSRDWSLLAGELGWGPTRFFLGTLGYSLGCLLVALALTGAWLHYRFRPALPSRTPPT